MSEDHAAPILENLKPISPEQANLIEQIKKLDRKDIISILEIFSMLVRAFQGKEVNPDEDVITRLINVKNILERSNFPSMPIINFQVWARLIAKYHPELDAFQDWADFQAQGLKSLKALSSEQYVDMFKAQQGAGAPAAATSIMFNPMMQQEKRSLMSRIRRPREPKFNEEEKE